MARTPRRFRPRPIQGQGGQQGRRVTYMTPQAYAAQQFQGAMDDANRANEQRYQQILSGYDDLMAQTQGVFDQQANVARQDVEQNYRNNMANAYQQLVGRGFGNSSYLATQGAGATRRRNTDLARIGANQAAQQAALNADIGMRQLGVMENRADVGPDYAQLYQMMNDLGQSGMGGGGFGGGFSFNNPGYFWPGMGMPGGGPMMGMPAQMPIQGVMPGQVAAGGGVGRDGIPNLLRRPDDRAQMLRQRAMNIAERFDPIENDWGMG